MYKKYENNGQLMDESIIDFTMNCCKMDVNYLVAVRTMLNVAKGEIRLSMEQLANMYYKNLTLTKQEFIDFVSQLASMGGLIANIDAKLEIVAYEMQVLTPDCFKSSEKPTT